MVKSLSEILKLKARINKANGQININIPKKEVSKVLKDKLCSGKTFKINIRDIEW